MKNPFEGLFKKNKPEIKIEETPEQKEAREIQEQQEEGQAIIDKATAEVDGYNTKVDLKNAITVDKTPHRSVVEHISHEQRKEARVRLDKQQRQHEEKIHKMSLAIREGRIPKELLADKSKFKKFIFDDLRLDVGLVEALLKKAPPEFLDDRDIIQRFLGHVSFAMSLPGFPEKFKKDPELMTYALRYPDHADSIRDAAPELLSNKDFMMKAVKLVGEVIYYASPELQNDPELGLAALTEIILSREFARMNARSAEANGWDWDYREIISNREAQKGKIDRVKLLNNNQDFVLKALEAEITPLKEALEKDHTLERGIYDRARSRNLSKEEFIRNQILTDQLAILHETPSAWKEDVPFLTKLAKIDSELVRQYADKNLLDAALKL